MADLSEQAALEQLTERLTGTYADVPPDRIVAAIHAAHARFDESSIRDFVPLLVERRVRSEMREIVASANL